MPAFSRPRGRPRASALTGQGAGRSTWPSARCASPGMQGRLSRPPRIWVRCACSPETPRGRRRMGVARRAGRGPQGAWQHGLRTPAAGPGCRRGPPAPEAPAATRKRCAAGELGCDRWPRAATSGAARAARGAAGADKHPGEARPLEAMAMTSGSTSAPRLEHRAGPERPPRRHRVLIGAASDHVSAPTAPGCEILHREGLGQDWIAGLGQERHEPASAWPVTKITRGRARQRLGGCRPGVCRGSASAGR